MYLVREFPCNTGQLVGTLTPVSPYDSANAPQEKQIAWRRRREMVAICGGMWYKVWYKWNRKTFRRPPDAHRTNIQEVTL